MPRGCFLEDLKALAPDLDPRDKADPGDVATRARKARREPQPDWITQQNDWYCAGYCGGGLYDLQVGNDHIRVLVDDLAEEVGIALGPPLTGIPLDGEVLSLDIA